MALPPPRSSQNVPRDFENGSHFPTMQYDSTRPSPSALHNTDKETDEPWDIFISYGHVVRDFESEAKTR